MGVLNTGGDGTSGPLQAGFSYTAREGKVEGRNSDVIKPGFVVEASGEGGGEELNEGQEVDSELL